MHSFEWPGRGRGALKGVVLTALQRGTASGGGKQTHVYTPAAHSPALAAAAAQPGVLLVEEVRGGGSAEEQKLRGLLGTCAGLSAQKNRALLLPSCGALPSMRLRAQQAPALQVCIDAQRRTVRDLPDHMHLTVWHSCGAAQGEVRGAREQGAGVREDALPRTHPDEPRWMDARLLCSAHNAHSLDKHARPSNTAPQAHPSEPHTGTSRARRACMHTRGLCRGKSQQVTSALGGPGAHSGRA